MADNIVHRIYTTASNGIMASIRIRIEKLFERSGYFFYRNWIMTLLVMSCFIGIFVSQLWPVVDTSSEGMLYKDDPGIITYDKFRDQFTGMWQLPEDYHSE